MANGVRSTTGFKPAGYVNVKSVQVYSFADASATVDLVANFTNIVIYESMVSPFLHGYIDIVDPYGLIYKSIENKPISDSGRESGGSAQSFFPHIHGEEYLILKYQDDRSEDEHREEYFIYSVSDIRLLEDRKETALQYRLHFCSPQKMFANTDRIRKAYRNMTISDMVSAIFREYYYDNENAGKYKKRIYIEETTGQYTIAIPNLKPEEALQFLAKKAYSSTSKSSAFFFFETRDAYYFYTHEGLKAKFGTELTTDLIYEYNNGPNDNTPAGQDRAKQIISQTKLSPVNTSDHIKKEAYLKNISEMDILNRSIRRYSYDYSDFYSNYNNIDNLRLNNSEAFISAIKKNNFEDTFVFKDYAKAGENQTGIAEPVENHRPDPYYVETYSTKPVFFHWFLSNKMEGRITGRKNLHPGQIINVKIPEFSVNHMVVSSENVDIDNSGPQIIVDMTHSIKGNVWETKINFTKAGKGGGPASRPTADAGPELRETVLYGETEFTSPYAGEAGTSTGARPEGWNPDNPYPSNSEQVAPGQGGTADGPIPGLTEIDGLYTGAEALEARQNAEEYLGREMTDTEWDYLVRATVAEAGTKSSQEQAQVMGVILNRVKSSAYPNDVTSVLLQSRQFQAVTGEGRGGDYVRTNGFRIVVPEQAKPSDNFKAPTAAQINRIVNAVNTNLPNANRSWLNFTSNITGAYGPGTDISFRDRLLSSPGSQVIGDSVFGTERPRGTV